MSQTAASNHPHFQRLLEVAAPLPPLPISVIAPEKADALAGALLGRDKGLIEPVLIGDAKLVNAAAEEIGADISDLELIDVPGHDEAAARGVALVHEDRSKAVMKGHLHSDQLLRAVLKKEGGLRTKRRLSHVFVQDVPGHDRLVFITDAAINVAPDLETKASICQNAIDLARSLQVAEPKVAVLSAVENVNPAIPSSLEAGLLAKMADRGQIKGGLVEGPLAMDNAIDLEAAAVKGIAGPVAGAADILLVPGLEAGNMLVKGLTFLADAQTAGLVLGAQVPVILTSRADDDAARLASCVTAVLHAASGA